MADSQKFQAHRALDIFQKDLFPFTELLHPPRRAKLKKKLLMRIKIERKKINFWFVFLWIFLLRNSIKNGSALTTIEPT